ncbi:hypothetical protein PMIN04_012921 [Paraphaeosphaeria minitans]|uniref:S-adenosyl-L-methionine-dependent methyltransferase n=1 Tax=Paraphaeosphaeria minitans TaxID=565426 RepID=A0A9P6G643_9PLEO|nr:hypothetical protein PMIN01_13582 [Paraphaeosphaeria minitans]
MSTLSQPRPTENEIAMRGSGYYNKNSSLQHVGALSAVELFPDLSHKSRLTLVDYGCSQGANSIAPIKQLLSTLPDGSSAHIIFNDRPYNDFSALAATIKQHGRELDRNRSLMIFPSMVPISFYNPVTSPTSVDIGVSWSSFNYLEYQQPLLPASDLATLVKQRTTRNAKHAHSDLVKLLRLRAAEIKPGGCFIFALGGRVAGNQSPNAVAQAMMVAIKCMVENGTLTQEQMIALDPPMYERSMEECDEAFTKLAALWTVERKFERIVAHPAYVLLQEKKAEACGNEAEEIKASREYASIVVDWIVASFSWFFVKALRAGVDEEEQLKTWTSSEESLLEEFAKMTKEVFLTSFQDQKVEFCYLYFKLSRN